MYPYLLQKLREREKPIQVAVIGCGWYGNGLIRELDRMDGISPKLIINRDTDKAHELLSQIECECMVASDIAVLKDVEGIDAIFDATGDLLAGAQAALIAFENRIPFLTISSEMDSTIGLALAKRAAQSGAIYSMADGDQPGVLKRMIDEISFWGFETKVAGNSKGFMDIYQTPEGVKPYVPAGQNIHKICGFADGSKQSMEMATLGNACVLFPRKRGMYGPICSKDEIVETMDRLIHFDQTDEAYIDYVLGLKSINEGAGVFVVAKREGAQIKNDLKYLKKGNGPYYLFFRDHHLCYVESVVSILEAVLLSQAFMVPQGRYTDVITLSKRDLDAGQKIDGPGGFDIYGQVERASITSEMNYLPYGLAEFATLKADIPKDTIITYDMVELDENEVVELRREVDVIDAETVFSF